MTAIVPSSRAPTKRAVMDRVPMRAHIREWLQPRIDRIGASVPGLRNLARSAVDAAIIALSLGVAYSLRFGEVPTGEWRQQYFAVVGPLLVMHFVAARLVGSHRTSWRLFTLIDVERLALAAAIVTGTWLLGRPLLGQFAPPMGVIALEGVITLAGQWGVRQLCRWLEDGRSRHVASLPRMRALLVGADRDGRLIAQELLARPEAGYEPVGFLDSARERHGRVIGGVPVLGTVEDIDAVVRAVGAQVIILTMPSATRAARRAVVERCRATGLPIRTVPAYWELLGGSVEVARIRKVQIEDLLGREVVAPSPAAIVPMRAAFAGKVVLVTGAGGSIGSELCRQIAAFGPAKLVLFENHENNLFEIHAELRGTLGDRLVACLGDVRSADEVDRAFQEHRPQAVFHAAAYKHVPMMEAHPCASVDNNVHGTRVIVDAVHQYRVERFVFISTDKAVNPTSVMGATKRAGELLVQARARASATKMCCVRFGNVLGSRGSVLHTFQRQIEAGGPVTVTHPDMTRFFMTIPEAVRLVLQAGAGGQGGEVFLLDMGEPVKIIDMARQMVRLAGCGLDEVPIEFVGLRPGEKLYEELVHDGEAMTDSGMPGIMCVRPEKFDALTIVPWVTRLVSVARRNDSDGVRELLARGTGYYDPRYAESRSDDQAMAS